MPVIASDSTYGTKNRSRKIARPGKRRLRSTASPSENGIWRSERQDDDQDVVAHRLPEHVARDGHLVVLKPDEVVQRAEAVPLVQAEVRGLDDRDDDEDEIEQRARAAGKPIVSHFAGGRATERVRASVRNTSLPACHGMGGPAEPSRP